MTYFKLKFTQNPAVLMTSSQNHSFSLFGGGGGGGRGGFYYKYALIARTTTSVTLIVFWVSLFSSVFGNLRPITMQNVYFRILLHDIFRNVSACCSFVRHYCPQMHEVIFFLFLVTQMIFKKSYRHLYYKNNNFKLLCCCCSRNGSHYNTGSRI